ncbi:MULTISPECIES: hypothetical protein [Paraburkholderia]|uniref:hypothetical protein n=1 Tax=Paraburkholderia TaxID=1822464 RepID=UPI00149622B9|nr:hypothetical protein [Paraburkholderia fungorum]
MAAVLAPCTGALNPETSILTDPNCLLTRNWANDAYLKISLPWCDATFSIVPIT